MLDTDTLSSAVSLKLSGTSDNVSAGTLPATGASGFFVQDTASLGAILFDVEIIEATPPEKSFTLDANLLVSGVLAAFLLDQGLAEADLSGADVGDAQVAASTLAVSDGGGDPQPNSAVVPAPASLPLFLSALAAGLGFMGRKNKKSA